ncbi:MAG: DUF2589 domain-containing protein [Bacteroidaceae bacterium]|nr:DUF2589 domain-containing protein [Bacteroidaceae bacterium]
MDELIGRPMESCMRAQSIVNEASQQYIREVGFQPTAEGKGTEEWEAVFMSFSCEIEGRRRRLSVPLLTLVPIPTFTIETAAMSFVAQTQFDEEGKMVGTYGPGGSYNEQTRFQGKVRVKFHMESYEPPTGLAKVLNLYYHQGTHMKKAEEENTNV